MYRTGDKKITGIRHAGRGIAKAVIAGATVFAVAAAAVPVVSFLDGTGYAGTTYHVENGGTGQWQADGQNIEGQTTHNYLITPPFEGRAIRWLRSDGVASIPVRLWVPRDRAGLVEHVDLRRETTFTLDANGQLIELRNMVNNAPRVSSSTSRTFEVSVLAQNKIRALKGNGATVLRGDISFTASHLLAVVVGRFDTLVAAERLISLSVPSSDDWSGANRAALINRWGSRTQIRSERGQQSITALPILDNNLSIMAVRYTPTQGQFYLDDRVSNLLTYSEMANFNPSLMGYMGQPRDIDRSQGFLQTAFIYGSNTAFSTEDVQRARGYCAHAFGLTDRLAANDPFKTVAPRV